MKPWDSARSLKVCGENPDKFIPEKLEGTELLDQSKYRAEMLLRLRQAHW